MNAINTIDPQAAKRWHQMPLQTSPWLHDEVSRRMQMRLDDIQCKPTTWLHWAALSGGVETCQALMQRYPLAVGTVLETTNQRAQIVMRQLQQLQPLLHRQHPSHGAAPDVVRVVTQITQPVQMLWANMALHTADDPDAMMSQWHQALEVDGFLMFSCLGTDSLKSLRDIYEASGWPAPAHTFADMHDWGDRLAAAGFANVVMDMEYITLDFVTPERLLHELRGLGRNLGIDRFGALRGRQWYRKLLQALAQPPQPPSSPSFPLLPLQLDFEIVYGHAFKPAPRHAVRAHSTISLTDMRTALGRAQSPESPVRTFGADR